MSVASRCEATLIFDLHVSPVLHAHLLGGRIWPRGYDETQLKHQRFSRHMDVSSNGGNPKSAKIVSRSGPLPVQTCSMTSSCSFMQGKS